MSIREEREEFNSTGWRGALRKLMNRKDEGYIALDPGGWRGKAIANRPDPGTGAYIHFKRGQPIRRYNNSSLADLSFEEIQGEV
jgi:hypothetical protein